MNPNFSQSISLIRKFKYLSIIHLSPMIIFLKKNLSKNLQDRFRMTYICNKDNKTHIMEVINNGKNEIQINSFTELHEWLSSKRMLKSFLDWCDTIKGENISRMLIQRAAKLQIEDQTEMTPRQRLCFSLGQEFVQNVQNRVRETEAGSKVSRLLIPERSHRNNVHGIIRDAAVTNSGRGCLPNKKNALTGRVSEQV